MSAQHQQQETSTKTTNITDSYNTTSTVNRIFDNAGNTNVYLNSEPKQEDTPALAGFGFTGQNSVMIIGILAAVFILSKGKS